MSGSDDGTVRVWDAATGAPLGDPLAIYDNHVNSVAIGRIGSRDVIVSGSGNGELQVWDAAARQLVGGEDSGHRGPVNSVAIGRAGEFDVIVSGSDDRTVFLRVHCTAPPEF